MTLELDSQTSRMNWAVKGVLLVMMIKASSAFEPLFTDKTSQISVLPFVNNTSNDTEIKTYLNM